MNLIQSCLTLNILVVVSFLISFTAYGASRRFNLMTAQQLLRLNYLLLTFTLGLSVAQAWLPKKEFFTPPAKVWSASSSKTFNANFSSGASKGYLRLDFMPAVPPLETRSLSLIFEGIALLALAFGILRLARDLRSLLKITRKSFLIRRFKSVAIYSSDHICVPFSFWVPGLNAVAIPNSMMGCPADARVALLHELQHHRQRDTSWVYLLWLFRVLCCWNPAVYFWNKLILEIQEFACDETLVDQNKVSPHAYAGCLMRVAETALQFKNADFVCATGLSFVIDGHSLTRRIQDMFKTKKRRLNIHLRILVILIVAGSLAVAAMASQSLIQDRRVTLRDAQSMVATLKPDDFPVTVNDLVLKQLNRYIGTPEGREFMQLALSRMENYRPLISKKIAGFGAPEDLLAVPLIESGYQDLSQSPPAQAAGLWQFIPSTARNFGLQVTQSEDQRLNIGLSTDAALRYLTSNHLRFKDWALAVFAYNVGEARVQEAIDKTGSRDVWTLIRAGYENDNDYVPKLMAAILIMRNPSVLQ